jgi:coenzyme F420-0:L-glutamate ligase/coenzyme F420-1:gamma-L-glutamate ligase
VAAAEHWIRFTSRQPDSDRLTSCQPANMVAEHVESLTNMGSRPQEAGDFRQGGEFTDPGLRNATIVPAHCPCEEIHRVGWIMIADAQGAIFEDLVQQRRSIRHFQAVPVSRVLITEILRTVMWSPSPHNVQPWRFTVLFDDADKVRLADSMASRLEEDLRLDGMTVDIIDQQTTRSRRRVTSAPVVLVCSLVGDGLVTYGDERRTALEWQMAVHSLGAALQTLFLAAATRDLGTCWMAAPMYCPEEVKSALALPDDYAPQALVLMGYPSTPGKIRERRSLEEVVDLR